MSPEQDYLFPTALFVGGVRLYFLQRATHGNSGRQGSVKSEGANSMSQPVVGAAAADEGYGLAGRNQMH